VSAVPPEANVEATTGEDERTGGPPRVLGRYRVIAELGRGSTSIVYLGAIDGPSGYSKLFALKLLRPLLAADPAMVALFLMEARIGAHLNHPNVVATLEIEEREAQPFIVMEYLDGKPLQEVITSARIAFTPLPLHMHLAALSGALEGLGHAHAAVGPGNEPLGIVHRDVSPHNVFVTVSGTPKVLDFGFAQTAHSPNTMLTSAARVAYMSPEQATGALVDARSDLFSLGVMMWEAVTRRRFWSEEASKAEILRALRSGELPPHRESALAKSSEEVRSIILKATCPDPNDRYTSATELQDDLRVVLSQITPPTFAPRDLGKRVMTLFAADRARLQRAIDQPSAGAPERAPVRRSAPPGAESGPLEERAAAVPAAATPASPLAPTAASAPPPAAATAPPPPRAALLPAVTERRSAWPIPHVLVAATLAIVIVSMLTIVVLRSNSQGTAPFATAAAVAPPATTSTEAVATAPQAPAVTALPTVEPPLPSTETAPVAPAETPPAATRPVAVTARLPVAPSASAPTSPAIRKPPVSSSSPDRSHADDFGERAPIPVMETRPPVARPPRPIDSSNPYAP
jgi:serine/threonine-protein kinase